MNIKILNKIYSIIDEKFKILKFFKFDIYIIYKINVDPKTLYYACRNNQIEFISHDVHKGELKFKYLNKYLN